VKVFADAVAAYTAGDLDEALRLGDQAKHIALRSVPVREFLGVAYYAAGRWNEAQRELAAFRRLSGSTEQNPVLADSYRAMEKPDKALALVDEMDPKVDPAVFYEGQIVAAGALRDLGRTDEAIARLQALDLDPPVAESHHMRAWYVLADLLESKGRFTQALELFDAVSAVDDDSTDAGERAARLRGRKS
jgi:tetratricopeptide (TPR) repeat protein